VNFMYVSALPLQPHLNRHGRWLLSWPNALAAFKSVVRSSGGVVGTSVCTVPQFRGGIGDDANG
jgi:hypothetical protein